MTGFVYFEQLEDSAQRDLWPEYVRVGTLCALKSWAIWERSFQDVLPVASPKEVLVDGVFIQPLDFTSEPVALDRLKVFLDNRLGLGEEYFTAAYAGYACRASNRDALYGRHGFEGSSEIDIDPSNWQPSFYASIAITGGAVWEDVGDSARRADYWRWYLTTAIPQVVHLTDAAA